MGKFKGIYGTVEYTLYCRLTYRDQEEQQGDQAT